MNFLNLEYFLEIVDIGNFSTAARKKFVSEQSLSDHVKRLEGEIGVRLLKRDRNIVSLTSAGVRFVEGAKTILKARDEMLRDICTLSDKRKRKITIGIPTYEVPSFLPGLLTKYISDFPGNEITVIARPDVDRTGLSEVDLFFSFPLFSYPSRNAKLRQVYLIENDECAVVMRRGLLRETYGAQWADIERSLVKRKDLSILEKLPFIMLRDRHEHNNHYFDTVFQLAGLAPIIGFQSDNIDLNTAMCVNGIGAFIGPQDFCQRKFKSYFGTGFDELAMYPLMIPEINNALVICYNKDKELNQAEKNFIETAIEYLASNII